MSFFNHIGNENLDFSINILNKNFSLNTCLKYFMHVPHNHIEGTVSQIPNLGLSFYFTQSRKMCSKIYQTVTIFFVIRYKVGPNEKTEIRFPRHKCY